MGERFLGVGLTNAVGLALFVLFISFMLKVVFTKHEVEGLSEVVRMA